MNRKHYLMMTLAFILVGSGVLTVGLLNFTADVAPIDYIPYDAGDAIRSRTQDVLPPVSAPIRSTDGPNSAADYYSVGAVVDWYGYDQDQGTIVLPFELRAIGTDIEIWVALDLSFPDSRPVPVITADQVAYMVDEFDNNIYPITTQYFGTPDFLDGSSAQQGDAYFEETGRSVMLVSNIRDDMYYDASYPYYIVGFFWTVFEQAFDRNIISIDCMDWENRIGDDVLRPNLYEGVVAHEYQHLIHSDYNPTDATFMNEGCSMYAEPLCGYGVSWGDIGAIMATPDNSLTVWEDQTAINILADYGAALMWTVYLSDNYGGAALISYFVQAGVSGVTGVEQALAHFGYTETFDDVFHDWRIANLIHDAGYDYTTFDLGTLAPEATRVYEITEPFVTGITGTSFGETLSYLGDPTGVTKIGSYGSDYIKIATVPAELNPLFSFNGDDSVALTGRKTVETDFIVTLIGVDSLGAINAVETLNLNDATETYDDFPLNTLTTDGYVYLIVSADVGLADYSFSIEQGGTSSDTEDPVVTITTPTNGATVSNAVTITATATDNVGVTSVQYRIDGGVWTALAVAWDTTLVSDGTHSITVRAYDAALNFGEDVISVTVDNGGGGDVVYTEEVFIGSVAKFEVDYYAIDAQAGLMTALVEWSTSYNLDVYICTSADYTTAVASGEELASYTIPAAGTYYIAVRMISRNAKTTPYTLTVGYYTLA